MRSLASAARFDHRAAGAPRPPAIELLDVARRFPTPDVREYTALRDLTLTVQASEFCAITGPTGCGKLMTLALVAGLEPPPLGEARVLGDPAHGIGRRIGGVFPTEAVFP